jgi:hypothetical protein
MLAHETNDGYYYVLDTHPFFSVQIISNRSVANSLGFGHWGGVGGGGWQTVDGISDNVVDVYTHIYEKNWSMCNRRGQK